MPQYISVFIFENVRARTCRNFDAQYLLWVMMCEICMEGRRVGSAFQLTTQIDAQTFQTAKLI